MKSGPVRAASWSRHARTRCGRGGARRWPRCASVNCSWTRPKGASAPRSAARPSPPSRPQRRRRPGPPARCPRLSCVCASRSRRLQPLRARSCREKTTGRPRRPHVRKRRKADVTQHRLHKRGWRVGKQNGRPGNTTAKLCLCRQLLRAPAAERAPRRLQGQRSGSTRASASDRLSPPPRARWRALLISISLASRGGRACRMAPISLGVK